MFRKWGLLLAAVLSLVTTDVCAGELEYAGVVVAAPDGWQARDEKFFSGSVPSKARVFGVPDGGEVLVSVMVTEGVVRGLGRLSTTVLAKAYVEALAVSWGATVRGAGEGLLSEFCGGAPGYHLVATFGNEEFDYYGCIVAGPGNRRLVGVVTWFARDVADTGEARAGARLMPVVQSVQYD